ncbi:MAG: hypothetical protein WKF65_00425 [Gaiellaceae bacterium]
MTGQNGAVGDSGTLDGVRRLERALEGRSGADELAAARLAAARSEADRILIAAHAAGVEEGRRRAAALLAAAAAEAATIRAGGQADAQELQERVLAERDELVAELAAFVTGEGA